eukprot:s4_g12.t1
MRQSLVEKLRVGDLPGFPSHFNLQPVHLRGLDIELVTGTVPSCEGDDVVVEFLPQNGLRRVGLADSAGWLASALRSIGPQCRRAETGAACQLEPADVEG